VFLGWVNNSASIKLESNSDFQYSLLISMHSMRKDVPLIFDFGRQISPFFQAGGQKRRRTLNTQTL
jgi:hypothetical protein